MNTVLIYLLAPFTEILSDGSVVHHDAPGVVEVEDRNYQRLRRRYVSFREVTDEERAAFEAAATPADPSPAKQRRSAQQTAQPVENATASETSSITDTHTSE